MPQEAQKKLRPTPALAATASQLGEHSRSPSTRCLLVCRMPQCLFCIFEYDRTCCEGYGIALLLLLRYLHEATQKASLSSTSSQKRAHHEQGRPSQHHFADVSAGAYQKFLEAKSTHENVDLFLEQEHARIAVHLFQLSIGSCIDRKLSGVLETALATKQQLLQINSLRPRLLSASCQLCNCVQCEHIKVQ